MRCAIVDTIAGKIINAVEYDEIPSNPPPGFQDGVVAVQNDLVDTTWTWDGSNLAPPIVAPTPTLPVTQVTPRQARLALLGAGLLDQATTAVNGAGSAALITWEYASVFERNDPLITAIGSTLNLTPAQIDDLFSTAAKL